MCALDNPRKEKPKNRRVRVRAFITVLQVFVGTLLQSVGDLTVRQPLTQAGG